MSEIAAAAGEKPKRIQRQRTKGWRKPEGAIYVGRGSKWGNPFKVGSEQEILLFPASRFMPPLQGTVIPRSRNEAVELFRLGLTGLQGCVSYHRPKIQPLYIVRAELAGKDLMCWCPLDQPCHADVLLELANEAEV